MNEQDVIKIVQDEIAKAAQKAQYGVTRVPVHTHNNIDSPNLSQHSVIGFQTLNGAAGSNGVLDPLLLNGQAISFGETPNKITSSPSVYIYPLPIIYGYGTVTILELVSALANHSTTGILASDYTLTGSVLAGATSATLSSNWTLSTGALSTGFSNGDTRSVTYTNGSPSISWSGGISVGGATSAIRVATVWGGTTGTYGVKFSNSEIRNASFSNGSATITWVPPLNATASVNITQIANAQFKGGLAPYGTAIVFRNDDAGILQLWVRTQAGIFTDTWASVDLNLSIVD